MVGNTARCGCEGKELGYFSRQIQRSRLISMFSVAYAAYIEDDSGRENGRNQAPKVRSIHRQGTSLPAFLAASHACQLSLW